MEMIQEEDPIWRNARSGSISGGWYNTRRQYRSVAFGTWKVGGARDLSVKRGASEGESQLKK
ncbi:unnamed protein product [Gongylonema pulchrum]|uniref:Nef protein n=1 Tax=Gongylonema pulchrum TaxID=637853 RepID=A0A183ERP0_9BILA|nr:unnamed protein product [Gongylonema pulchrum]